MGMAPGKEHTSNVCEFIQIELTTSNGTGQIQEIEVEAVKPMKSSRLSFAGTMQQIGVEAMNSLKLKDFLFTVPFANFEWRWEIH